MIFKPILRFLLAGWLLYGCRSKCLDDWVVDDVVEKKVVVFLLDGTENQSL
jgi:hypothetical protein